MIQRQASRRGATLLLTLAGIVVVVTACVGITRLAVVSSLDRSMSHKADLCQDLLAVCDAQIVSWLDSDSRSIVLPPDSIEPMVVIANDMVSVDGVTLTIQIAAWDQCGMAPLQLMNPGSPLRSAVPDHVARAADELRGSTSENHFPGLDQLGGTDPYPTIPSTDLVVFGGQMMGMDLVSDDPIRIVAFGAIVATHNPPAVPRTRRDRKPKPSTINVNTAPIPLIEGAMRMAGRRGIEQIISARADGKTAPPVGNRIGKALPNAPRLVSASDSWGFRIDVSVDTVKRSWWVIYMRQGGSWRCEQRLMIA